MDVGDDLLDVERQLAEGVVEAHAAEPSRRVLSCGRVKAANAAFRFVLEMCTLARLRAGGASRPRTAPAALVRGFGVALLTVAAWGTFGAPQRAAARGAAGPARAARGDLRLGGRRALDDRISALLAVALDVPRRSLNTIAALIAFGQE